MIKEINHQSKMCNEVIFFFVDNFKKNFTKILVEKREHFAFSERS
jgi:hypothetical protein